MSPRPGNAALFLVANGGCRGAAAAPIGEALGREADQPRNCRNAPQWGDTSSAWFLYNPRVFDVIGISRIPE